MVQEVQPVIEIDSQVHKLGPQIQQLTQFNEQVVAAPGAARHAGFMFLPGADGAWLECFETAFSAVFFLFMSTTGVVTSPTGWLPGLITTPSFHSYNPANPQDRPTITGIAADFGGHINTGHMAAANIPANALALTIAVGEQYPRQGRPSLYIPPDNTFVILHATANTAIVGEAQISDPTFRTGANI